jgi:hypothetical protein
MGKADGWIATQGVLSFVKSKGNPSTAIIPHLLLRERPITALSLTIGLATDNNHKQQQGNNPPSLRLF